MSATASIEKQRIGAEINIRPKDIDPKGAFASLLADKDAIEQKMGFEVEWQELPEAASSRIAAFNQNVDVGDEQSWPTQFEWLADRLEKLHDVLGPRIKKL